MAAVTRFSVAGPGLVGGSPDPTALQTTNELLQHNHATHHIFFTHPDLKGVYMHNHLVHHALTNLSLGADANDLKKMYDINTFYQRPLGKPKPETLKKLSEESGFLSEIGDEVKFATYEKFFELEFEKHGVAKVLKEHLFADTKAARALFHHLLMGYFHPLIDFGFGVEFRQPALVAEGLGAAAAFDDFFLIPFFEEAEELSKKNNPESWTLAQLFKKACDDEKLRNATDWQTFDKLRGVLKTSRTEIAELASHFKVKADELPKRTAELINQTAYLIAAAQKRGKSPRFDFFLLHSTNCAMFLSAILESDWMDDEEKARLFTGFGRMNVLLYIGMGSPALDLWVVRNHVPKFQYKDWAAVSERIINHPDDGHASKMIRALIHAEKVSKPYKDDPAFLMKGDDFIKTANAIIDSLNPAGGRAGPHEPESWIRFSGFLEAWEKVPNV